MTLFSPNLLSSRNAFYNHPYYKDELKNEFNNVRSSCVYHSSQKTKKNHTPSLSYLLKRVLKWSLLPPLSRPKELGSTLVDNTRIWKYKRITMPIDGLSIDAAIMGRPSTLDNNRWVLVSVGRMERYEDTMTSEIFQKFLRKINANALFFNYPKVGASTGPRNAKNMVTAYRAMLEFLEDEQNGIGAKQIIGYGYSMGGGVQGKALTTHPLEEGMKRDIQYLFIKDRTFSSLQRAVRTLTKGLIEHCLPKFGWDLDSVESSKRLAKLQIPEIIVQTADEKSRPNSDGVISRNASLKQALLNSSLSHKWYVDIPNYQEDDLHSAPEVRFSEALARKVNALMKDKTRRSRQPTFFSWATGLFYGTKKLAITP